MNLSTNSEKEKGDEPQIHVQKSALEDWRGSNEQAIES